MRAVRPMLRALLGSALLVAPIRLAHAQEPLPTETLLKLGVEAYRPLPGNPSLGDAPGFAVALSNLFAYEQRAARDGGSIDPDVNRAFEWLVSHIENFKTGKADYSGNDLLDRGMERFRTARKSQTDGRIWDVRAYVSARANLYAYIQCESRPATDAISAHAWLLQMAGKLAVSGGAADDPRDASWLPSGPKPNLGAGIATLAGERVPQGTGAKAGRDRVGGERGGADASRPAEQPTASPASTASDSARDTTDEYRQLVVQLAAAQAENEQLRRENAELRAKLEQLKAEGAEGDRRLRLAERLRQEGRLPEACKVARAALAADPSNGGAHLLLARIYATASQRGSTPEDRAAVWLAIDHLTVALKQGALEYRAGLSELAGLEARAPTSADLKARGWVPGQKLRISFAPYEWIDEETTIRVRKE